MDYMDDVACVEKYENPHKGFHKTAKTFLFCFFMKSFGSSEETGTMIMPT